MGASTWARELSVHTFTWDVAKVGGAVGTIGLGNLPDGFVVTDAYASAETPLTGGGSAIVGEDGGGDADGYFTDIDAIAVATPIKATGALLNSSGSIPRKVPALTDGVQVTVATTPYTAGKVHFTFIGFQAY